VWQNCDPHELESVQKAFASSRRIGSDFVPRVSHRHNPFAVEPSPFLSRYVGEMQVPLSGRYVFFTSSQDCSFLLIDGQVVVAAPGIHRPVNVAKIKGEVALREGPHRFEYYHAAKGNACCMVAAWQLPGFDKPSEISPDVFRFDRVVHAPAVDLEHRDDGYLPDFRMAVVGDLPLPEGEDAMVRVQFANAASRLAATNARYLWQFGDGQTSDQASPGHVYLHPGRYAVTLRITRANTVLETLNWVYATRQFITDPKQHRQDEKLATYLERLESYNAASLDGAGLVQLVRAYLDNDQPQRAADAARAAFAPAATAQTDESLWSLANLACPVLQNELDDPRSAAEIWYRASQRIERDAWRATCAVASADILLHDLLAPSQAKQVLDQAANRLDDAPAAVRSRYHRVLGDWHARQGNADAARAAYKRAGKARELTYNAAERNAWRGAHSRSTEAYLRAKEFARARNELERWQRDFPNDKCDGYLSLLQMQYWIARDKHDQAIAVATDLLTVSPRSPYADQLVFQTARCEEALGRRERAIAAYQSLVIDYPGSPLVEQAKAQAQRIAAGKPEPDPRKQDASRKTKPSKRPRRS
jgi:TolA-binding protein